MKFAKICVIMVDVNKKVLVCPFEVVQLYNMHKNTVGFLWKPKKRKEKDSHG